MNKPAIVAHRGYSSRYPENTMLAFTQAVAAGARFIELDVQMSRDGVPVIIHDETLERTTDGQGRVMDLEWTQLAKVHAGENARFGDQFSQEKLPPLSALTDFLHQHSQVTAFVELKDESLACFGIAPFVAKVLEVLAPVQNQIVIISYNLESLIAARKLWQRPVGWVLTNFDDNEKLQAEAVEPEYIISNFKKVKGELWRGNWQWFLYEIVDPDLALQWYEKGAQFVESMAVGELLKDPRLVPAE